MPAYSCDGVQVILLLGFQQMVSRTTLDGVFKVQIGLGRVLGFALLSSCGDVVMPLLVFCHRCRRDATETQNLYSVVAAVYCEMRVEYS